VFIAFDSGPRYKAQPAANIRFQEFQEGTAARMLDAALPFVSSICGSHSYYSGKTAALPQDLDLPAGRLVSATIPWRSMHGYASEVLQKTKVGHDVSD
jgi:hypothetical protein